MNGDETLGGEGPKGAALPDSGSGTTADLIERARGGDRLAIDSLLARYLPVLRRWATGRLPRWARDLLDTDDMIQEALLGTLRNAETFTVRHDGALAAYLRLAVLNRIRDEVRKTVRRPRRDAVSDEHPDPSASPLEAAIGAEALQCYEQALMRLSVSDRSLIIARIEMGLSYDDVAREAGRPSPDAARVGVQRALVRLAREMDRG